MVNFLYSFQVYKEIVARSKTDDSYVTGTALRKILGIPLGDMKGKFKIDLSKIPDFDVFVQSTSYNRQLMPGKRNTVFSGGSRISCRRGAELVRGHRLPM